MRKLVVLALGCILLWPVSANHQEEWGFFGHRRLNRLAVFTLPPEMIVFFKKHIEYVTEHAVDPDKRRYATKHEAPRHYIDIDKWGSYPFSDLPRDWDAALMKYTDVYIVPPGDDTLKIFGHHLTHVQARDVVLDSVANLRAAAFWEGRTLSTSRYRQFFNDNILNQYYEESWIIELDSLRSLLGPDIEAESIFAIDRFSEHGIVPYHLLSFYSQLVEAFRQKSIDRLLRIATEMGHYIGDAHVPLHTTVNYNGQLTDQVGIHAFWESRIPELFADRTFDYFVGKAEYIENKKDYFWDIVLSSHRLVDSVLLIEKDLSKEYPQDRQYCFEERLGRTIRTQCTEYAAAYQDRLDGMVERRWRETIHSIGSVWFSAWVDAGKPDLATLAGVAITEAERQRQKELNRALQSGEAKGRPHDQ